MTQPSIGQVLLVKLEPKGIKGLAYRDKRFKETAANTCLECGILADGFARACCDACQHDFLIAYSSLSGDESEERSIASVPLIACRCLEKRTVNA